MWGVWVIVPKKLQETVLQELHQGHPGIVRMKSIAQLMSLLCHVWSPKLDHDIESLSKSCEACQSAPLCDSLLYL